jgi:hypothetical protein
MAILLARGSQPQHRPPWEMPPVAAHWFIRRGWAREQTAQIRIPCFWTGGKVTSRIFPANSVSWRPRRCPETLLNQATAKLEEEAIRRQRIFESRLARHYNLDGVSAHHATVPTPDGADPGAGERHATAPPKAEVISI